MRLQCPHCDVTLKFNTPPKARVRCPRCDETFSPPRARDAEAEPKPRRSAVREKPEKPEKTKPKKGSAVLLVLASLGGGVVIAGIAVAIIIVVGDTKPITPVIVGNPTIPPPGFGGEVPPKVPPDLVELFDDSGARPAPVLMIPVLNRTQQVEFDLPKFAALKAGGNPSPPRPPPEEGKLSIEEIKKAVVYIKVEAGLDSTTGSGFVFHAGGDTGMVATNCHVVAGALMPALRDPNHVPQVTVVFDSGLPSEKVVKGAVTAYDFETDLAVIRVEKVAKMPRPISPDNAVTPTETMPVLICGFPFGETLATGTRNPAITIGKGSVSSVRRNEAGDVAKVQIDGSVNPGNSGGPIIDTDGRLAGVAVQTIKGSGIGLAIPVGDLIGLLDGRLHPPLFMPAGLDDGSAVFEAVVPLMDPLKKIDAVSLYVAAGKAGDAQRGANGSWNLLSGATKVDLNLAGRAVATGQLRLPARDGVTTLQLACRYGTGEEAVSRPVAFRLNPNATQTPNDAMSLAGLNRAPEKFEGKTVVVRGSLSPGVVGVGDVYELQVLDEASARPTNLSFLTTFDVKTQINELPAGEQVRPVRMICRVGKRTAKGVTPVRVLLIEFLGGGNVVSKTVPSEDGLEDPLVALNRYHDRYAGRMVAFVALMSPKVEGQGPEMEPLVMMANGRKPDNLNFRMSKDMAAQLTGEGFKEDALIVRVMAQVENRTEKTSRFVTLMKIEVLERNGKVRKVIQ